MNLADIIILSLVIVVVIIILVYLIKKKDSGCSMCSSKNTCKSNCSDKLEKLKEHYEREKRKENL